MKQKRPYNRTASIEHCHCWLLSREPQNIQRILPRVVRSAMLMAVLFLYLPFTLRSAPVGPSELRMQTNTDNQRNEEVALIAILRDKKLRESDPARVVKAIHRLGELRSTWAIVELTQLLDLKDPLREFFRSPFDYGHRYPAMYALYQIGPPSLPALVQVIRRNGAESLNARNATLTIVYIFNGGTREKAVEKAVEFLKQNASEESEPTAKDRLLTAAKRAQEQ